MIEISIETHAKLVEVQKLDIEVNRLHQLEQDIPARKQEAASKLQPLKERLIAARESVKQVELEIDELNQKVEAQRSLQQKKLYEAKDTRDNESYRKLNAEAEQCEETISDIETEELNKMEELDEAKATIASTETEIKAALVKVQQRLQQIDDQVAECKQKSQDLLAKRPALIAGIDIDCLHMYERLLKSKGGVREIFVGVEEQCCGFCHMKLSLQQLSYAQISVQTCSSCGVYIYQ